MRNDPISQPQKDLIRRLADEKEVPVAGRTVTEATLIARFEDVLGQKSVTKGEASDVISWLLSLPRTAILREEPRREAPEKLQPGVYEVDGTVYIVRPTRDKLRTYAMRLVQISGQRLTEGEDQPKQKIDFEFDKGAIYKIKPEHRMPFERAKELTVLYSQCIVCGRHLEQGQSVERGIGPVCIKKFPDAMAGRKRRVRRVYEAELREVA